MLLLIIAIFAVGYLISLRVHPLRKCPVCKMTGRHFGGMYSYAYRRCRKCGGTGRMDRWGTQAFLGGTKNTGIFQKR